MYFRDVITQKTRRGFLTTGFANQQATD